MRKWLAKFRISAGLDADEPQRGQRPHGKSPSAEINQYEGSMNSLERRLKATHPTTPVPVALHASVMRAVRSAAESQERPSARWVLRWLPAPALAMLVVFGLWLLSRSPHESPSLTAPAIALEQGQEMAQKAPGVVLAPLSQEMNNLNRDFQNAVELLVASVP